MKKFIKPVISIVVALALGVTFAIPVFADHGESRIVFPPNVGAPTGVSSDAQTSSGITPVISGTTRSTSELDVRSLGSTLRSFGIDPRFYGIDLSDREDTSGSSPRNNR